MTTLAEPLRLALAAQDPLRPVVTEADGTIWTAADLLGRIAALQDWVADRGLQPGQRLALVLADGVVQAFDCLVLADHLSVMPLNPALGAAALTRIMTEAGSSLVLTDPGWAAPPALDLPVWRWSRDLSVGEAAPKGPMTHPPGLVLTTSGSTGTPKRVALDPAALVLSAQTIGRSLALTPQDCAVAALPVFHIGATVDLLLWPPCLRAGRWWRRKTRPPPPCSKRCGAARRDLGSTGAHNAGALPCRMD